MKRKIDDFYKRVNFRFETIDAGDLADKIITAMDEGLGGRPSSLKMLPSYLSPVKTKKEKPVIVIDAGGTSLRTGLVINKTNAPPELTCLKTAPVPGSEKEISSDEFYGRISEQIRDLLDKSDSIGFCFSYPVKITPDKDAVVLDAVKENKANIKGTKIGTSLSKAIGKNNTHRITVLNDSIANLLGGYSFYSSSKLDVKTGLIIGTGTNIAYIERGKTIKKVKKWKKDRMLINCESGNIDFFPASDIDVQIDRSSGNPGVHRAEKMISGKYLGKIVFYLAKTASTQGLFSPAVKNLFDNYKTLSTTEMSKFLINKTGKESPLLSKFLQLATDKEISLIGEFMNRVIDRGAFFTAIELYALLKKTGSYSLPGKTAGIVVDGSTFWKVPAYKDRVETYLTKFTSPLSRPFKILSLKNSCLIGAGLAGASDQEMGTVE